MSSCTSWSPRRLSASTWSRTKLPRAGSCALGYMLVTTSARIGSATASLSPHADLVRYDRFGPSGCVPTNNLEAAGGRPRDPDHRAGLCADAGEPGPLRDGLHRGRPPRRRLALAEGSRLDPAHDQAAPFRSRDVRSGRRAWL